ncbi:FAD-binding oxidoreductase [Albirhodobacter sp. R86504]|uniref:FAD-binding oxidoreductase n=1 Tax=Albirhodobacter sp. R86504 TaxID=3093848 RepID=UPI0036720A92
MLNPADQDFIQHLQGLGIDVIAPDTGYLVEPRGRYHGIAGGVARPTDTEQVSLILREANARRIGVVPFGGGTGLVGGQVMQEGAAPLLLSLEKMTRVRSVDPVGNVMVVEGGVTLQNCREAASDADRMFPLALASQGTARIGGCLSTNAGGVNVLRYGNARELCLGVEAVTADGTILRGLKRLRKDNTGYDLRGLLIGSEGTLGVITAASLRLVTPPFETGVALMSVRSPQAALELLARAEARMAGNVTAFELISKQGLDFLREVGPQSVMPLGQADWMVLMELGLPAGVGAEAAFADIYDEALVLDAAVAQSAAQAQAMWAMRENLPQANKRIGSISSHDISVPLADIPAFITRATQAIAELGAFRINCFGHVGDGNLHFNVFPPQGHEKSEFDPLRAAIKRCVHEVVDQFDGSVSAEHGVGRLKVEDLERFTDPAKLTLMRAVKSALDPNGIMNPGAVLRA